eukprot:m.17034 g.17034  ORF g.17034 m.17034 type:complete len:322 (+) comp7296_c0_seq2:39-1004(+)
MEELMGMGFDAEASRQAWQMYGNLEHAVNHLLTNPHPTSTQVAPSVAAPSAAGALQLTEAGSTAAPTTTEPDAITDSAASPAVPEPELTEEQKQAKYQEMQERLRVKKAEREAREKKEAIEKEKARRKDGQFVSSAKEDFEQKQMQRLAEERRREKKRQHDAKMRVKQLIAEDRARQKAQAGRADATNGASVVAGQSQVAASSTAATAFGTTPPTVRASPDEFRMQFVVEGVARPIRTMLHKDKTIADVYNVLAEHGVDSSYNLILFRPAKTFTLSADARHQLKDLELPSSVSFHVKRPAAVHAYSSSYITPPGYGANLNM